MGGLKEEMSRLRRAPNGRTRVKLEYLAGDTDSARVTVSEGGLEPPRAMRPLGPQPSASAYSATPTRDLVVLSADPARAALVKGCVR